MKENLSTKYEILNKFKTQNPSDQNLAVLNLEHLALGFV
jgi:hypothetical protein